MTNLNETPETQNPIDQTAIMQALEDYKQTNDERLIALERKAAVDPLVDQKLSRIDQRLDALSFKAAMPDVEPDVSAVESHPGWRRYLRYGDDSDLIGLDTKSMSTEVDGDGGYVVPAELDRLIESRLTQSSPMRQIASVRQTSASSYRKPVSHGVGALWVGETASRPETAIDSLTLIDFPTGEIYAMPAATQTLLDDAYADIDAWLADEVDAAFSAQESAAFISGDGQGKPRGLLDYPRVDEAVQSWGNLGVLQADFTMPDAGDQLIDLIHAPREQYRANGRFIMNRRTTAAIRKLKDANGQYLWAPGRDGATPSILGYPITEIEDMPDIGSDMPAIAFGDFRRGYLIVDRQGARVLRDPFSAKPYILFYTTKRIGGGIQNFDAIKFMQA